MKEMIPGLKRVMTFYNPSSPLSVSAGLDNARLAAEALGIELVLREVRSAADTRNALHAMHRAKLTRSSSRTTLLS